MFVTFLQHGSESVTRRSRKSALLHYSVLLVRAYCNSAVVDGHMLLSFIMLDGVWREKSKEKSQEHIHVPVAFRQLERSPLSQQPPQGQQREETDLCACCAGQMLRSREQSHLSRAGASGVGALRPPL